MSSLPDKSHRSLLTRAANLLGAEAMHYRDAATGKSKARYLALIDAQEELRAAAEAAPHYAVTGPTHVVCQCDKCKSTSSAKNALAQVGGFTMVGLDTIRFKREEDASIVMNAILASTDGTSAK